MNNSFRFYISANGMLSMLNLVTRVCLFINICLLTLHDIFFFLWVGCDFLYNWLLSSLECFAMGCCWYSHVEKKKLFALPVNDLKYLLSILGICSAFLPPFTVAVGRRRGLSRAMMQTLAITKRSEAASCSSCLLPRSHSLTSPRKTDGVGRGSRSVGDSTCFPHVCCEHI